MMYKNMLAVAIKSNGKVLREFDENVYIPFGSEYSILIKNLNSVRVVVNVSIDGTDAGDGSQFIINSNDSLDLERFLKNENTKKGNRFKFIERTDNIEQHRGIGVEDGLIRIEFQFESIVQHYTPHWRDAYWHKPRDPYTPYFGDSVKKEFLPTSNNTIFSTTSVSDCSTTTEVPSNDAGITVPGSISDQEFKITKSFPVEAETHVIVLKLLGETEDNKRITKPVTVKTKIECETCGKKNKATDKFCSECGTSLTII